MTTPPRREAGTWLADTAFFVLAVASGALLVYLGRSLTFWYDEWSFITFSGSGLDYFDPHNEHWVTLPLVLYRGTLETVGLRSYVPYLAELVALHLLAVGAAYVLLRRRLGPPVASLLVIPLLVLGAGSENLYWAFQITFVGSVAFGLWALVLVEQSGRRSLVLASASLLASLMSSGLGLVFLVALGVRTLLDASLRERSVAVIPPFLAFLCWFAVVGYDGLTQPAASPQQHVRFVLVGIGHATSRIVGLGASSGGRVVGFGLFTALVLALGVMAVRRRPRPLAAGCAVAIVTLYGIAGGVRGGLQAAAPTRGRYTYVAAFLLVIAIGDVLAGSKRPFSRTSLRSTALATAALVVAVGWSTAANVEALVTDRSVYQARADETRAYVGLALSNRGESWVRGDPLGVEPPVPSLLEAVERFGSPLRDTDVAIDVRHPATVAQEAALLAIVGDGLRSEPAKRPGRPSSASIVRVERATISARHGCIELEATGDDPAITVSVPEGTRLRVRVASRVSGSFRVGRVRPPSRVFALNVLPLAPLDIVTPRTGDGGVWSIALQLRHVRGAVELCPTRPL